MTSELRVDPLTGLRLLLAGDGPVLSPDAPAPAMAGPMLDRSPNARKDLFWSAPALGTVETLPWDVDSLADTLERWRERIAAHSASASVHVAVDSTVAQLYAFPTVPQLIARERELFGSYATRTMGGNLLADLVQEEVRERRRIVAIDDDTVLMAPYGSRVPYQLLIAPRRPRRAWEEPGPTGAAMLADALRRLTARFEATPSFNLWIRTAPRGAEFFCWRIDLLPRLREPTGLELGTGIALNPVAPERVAAELRDL